MAKKVKSKKKPVCPECGAAKRPNTLFCYSCGSRVADGPVTLGALPEAPGRNASVNEREPGAEARSSILVFPPDESADREVETKAALDDLAEKFRIEPPDEDKLAKAAAERKKARVASRQPKEFRWDPADEGGSRLIILLAVLVFVISTAVVMLTVIWK